MIVAVGSSTRPPGATRPSQDNRPMPLLCILTDSQCTPSKLLFAGDGGFCIHHSECNPSSQPTTVIRQSRVSNVYCVSSVQIWQSSCSVAVVTIARQPSITYALTYSVAIKYKFLICKCFRFPECRGSLIEQGLSGKRVYKFFYQA